MKSKNKHKAVKISVSALQNAREWLRAAIPMFNSEENRKQCAKALADLTSK